MSKPVKDMMTRQYRQLFGDLTDAVLVDIRGVPANENVELRNGLRAKDIRITVVKNSLARRALADTALEQLNELIEGPTALAYGGESVVNVARELTDWARKIATLDLKGAIMEGTVFSAEEVSAKLSKYPTRDEAQAEAVMLVLSPARRLVGQIVSPGATVASLIKAIQEKLEAGEEIKAA